MKNIDDLKEMPGILGMFWPSLEVLKADMELAHKNSERTDELMAKMLTPMTSDQAAEVMAELKSIATLMNKTLGEKLNKHGPAGGLGMLAFGQLMVEYAPKSEMHLTREQFEMLHETGVYDSLVRGESQ